jgi:hypothetical protein
LKTVLSLTHVVVYKQRNEAGSEILIASKQLYANHYFEGSLGLTWVINAEDGCYSTDQELMVCEAGLPGLSFTSLGAAYAMA